MMRACSPQLSYSNSKSSSNKVSVMLKQYLATLSSHQAVVMGSVSSSNQLYSWCSSHLLQAQHSTSESAQKLAGKRTSSWPSQVRLHNRVTVAIDHTQARCTNLSQKVENTVFLFVSACKNDAPALHAKDSVHAAIRLLLAAPTPRVAAVALTLTDLTEARHA
jgi:hypothetical protein